MAEAQKERQSMTLQQKRRAMAEACPGIFGFTVSGAIFWRDTMSDVTEREWLYACWLAVKTLTDRERAEYSHTLKEVIGKNESEHVLSYSVSELHEATESQRLDAWLKVKGLWRE